MRCSHTDLGGTVIVSKRKYLFGISFVSVIQNDAFRCVVTTAPEGLNKGHSAVIQTFDGEWGAQRNVKLVAKALFHPSLSKRDRQAVHDAIVAHLDDLGSRGTMLSEAIDRAFAQATERKVVVDSVNEALWLR